MKVIGYLHFGAFFCTGCWRKFPPGKDRTEVYSGFGTHTCDDCGEERK